MKIFNDFLHFFINTFFSSATPNLFGSRKRRKEKEALAGNLRRSAEQTQTELDREMAELEVQNPFESAAAKSAMATSSRKARQIQKRFANVMGGRTNPESIIAAQQALRSSI